jgi:hypothetical protein
MRKVEQFELMRRDFEREGLSVRAIAGKYGVHRRKVREAIELSVPPERKVPARACPVLTVEVKDFVEAILTNDKKAPRKQRHTAHRIWQRVRDELGGAVAESTVRAYVAERRRELGIGQAVFVPQHHEIGAQAEADFYEADFDFPWGRQRAQIIVVRSEFSAGARHVAYPTQAQPAFLEGLGIGLEFLGGVFPILRFDYVPRNIIGILCPSALCALEAARRRSPRIPGGERLEATKAGHITLREMPAT